MYFKWIIYIHIHLYQANFIINIKQMLRELFNAFLFRLSPAWNILYHKITQSIWVVAI